MSVEWRVTYRQRTFGGDTPREHLFDGGVLGDEYAEQLARESLEQLNNWPADNERVQNSEAKLYRREVPEWEHVDG